MENDRRKFLQAVGSFGAVLLTLPVGTMADTLTDDFGGAAFPNPSNNEIFSQEDFTAKLKQWFYLHSDDAVNQGDVKLIRVRDLGSNDEMQQFALVLRGRRGAEPLAGGMYQVAGEPFSLFLKRGSENRGQHIYTAEFALLR